MFNQKFNQKFNPNSKSKKVSPKAPPKKTVPNPIDPDLVRFQPKKKKPTLIEDLENDQEILSFLKGEIIQKGR